MFRFPKGRLPAHPHPKRMGQARWVKTHCQAGEGVPQKKQLVGQAELLRLLTPLHRDRLHRTLARALLYSGGYEDTRVVTSTQRSGATQALKYYSVKC